MEVIKYEEDAGITKRCMVLLFKAATISKDEPF